MRLTKKERIYKLLLESDRPLTDAEIAKKLRMNPNTSRPRRIELEREGKIVMTDEIYMNGRWVMCWWPTARLPSFEESSLVMSLGS